VIRVPIGAYGSGGPYHSSSIESVLTNIRGIKVVYPSSGADLKGLLKAAYYDPNPVVLLEHKGLYWSKIKGTEESMSIEPSADYVIPIGKARLVSSIPEDRASEGGTVGIITYGRGVYWSIEAIKGHENDAEILDLRSLNPMDHDAMNLLCQKHGKILLVTEESIECNFTLGLAGRIQRDNFNYLDAPIEIVGAIDTPAIPLNSDLEVELLPNAEKVKEKFQKLLKF
jgi:2-oxoisovalerate dehydrogenase E1 component